MVVKLLTIILIVPCCCKVLTNAFTIHYSAVFNSEELLVFHKEATIEIARMLAMIPNDSATGIL